MNRITELQATIARLQAELTQAQTELAQEQSFLDFADNYFDALDGLKPQAQTRTVARPVAHAQTSNRPAGTTIETLRAFMDLHGRRPRLADFRSGGLLEDLYGTETQGWLNAGLTSGQIADKYYQRAQSLVSKLGK